MIPLPRSFYSREPALVARELLGTLLLRRSKEGLTGGRIVETEAYLAEGDSSSHSHRGPTKRNASMFGPAGHAYVYTIHAKWCVNVVTEDVGRGSAVLIRAIEPLFGLPVMQQRRGREKLLELARGPARLCQALDIDRRLDGWDLTLGKELWISDGAENRLEEPIVTSSRVGISSATELMLRFFYEGNSFVSGKRSARK
jgi:DNA-3-methyladenine glycosylase